MDIMKKKRVSGLLHAMRKEPRFLKLLRSKALSSSKRVYRRTTTTTTTFIADRYPIPVPFLNNGNFSNMFDL